MLYAQFSGARGLREIETSLQSHAGKLYHLGGARCRSRRSRQPTRRVLRKFRRPAFGPDGAVAARISAENRRLRASDRFDQRAAELSGEWATFSAGVCGAKAHIIYDPDADQPLYLMVTPANVNDITAAKQMPIEPGATYVFDLGYYDYGWWARLDEAGCRIVTRLKANTPFAVVEDRPVAAGSSILSDRTGHLPKRLAASRNNPMSGWSAKSG